MVPLPSPDVLRDSGAHVVAAASSSSSLASIGLGSLYESSRYSFMLPAAALVATSCQLAGIGGAALFSPIFLLVFPALGLELASPAQAVASALLTEVFGFASGLSGYARRGLVDWRTASEFAAVSVPSALLGALAARDLDVASLRASYAALMLGLAAFLALAPRPDELERSAADEECAVPFGEDDDGLRSVTTADGTVYTYLASSNSVGVDGDDVVAGVGATLAGSALTGLLGVGVGEVVIPQLVRGRCMPLPVAAGTSVAVVVVTALTAAVVQFLNLAASLSAADGDGDLLRALVSVVPWDLVQYTVPGVLVGGQLAPLLASQGRFSDEQIERFAATLFALVGIAFAVKAVSG